VVGRGKTFDSVPTMGMETSTKPVSVEEEWM